MMSAWARWPAISAWWDGTGEVDEGRDAKPIHLTLERTTLRSVADDGKRKIVSAARKKGDRIDGEVHPLLRRQSRHHDGPSAAAGPGVCAGVDRHGLDVIAVQ